MQTTLYLAKETVVTTGESTTRDMVAEFIQVVKDQKFNEKAFNEFMRIAKKYGGDEGLPRNNEDCMNDMQSYINKYTLKN